MPETNSKNSVSVNRPIQIIPSVLPADWANMGACVKDLEEAGVDRIQFDVMDGNFVPNLTFGPLVAFTYASSMVSQLYWLTIN